MNLGELTIGSRIEFVSISHDWVATKFVTGTIVDRLSNALEVEWDDGDVTGELEGVEVFNSRQEGIDKNKDLRRRHFFVLISMKAGPAKEVPFWERYL